MVVENSADEFSPPGKNTSSNETEDNMKNSEVTDAMSGRIALQKNCRNGTFSARKRRKIRKTC